MICKKCGQEFEGEVCPRCGENPRETAETNREEVLTDSLRLTKKEPKKKSLRGFKNAASSDKQAKKDKKEAKSKKKNRFVVFAKKHKIFISITAVVLLLSIVVAVVGIVLSNPFRAEKMETIKIGMQKQEVNARMGDPHYDKWDEWFYYSDPYKKLVDEKKKLTPRDPNEKISATAAERIAEIDREAETTKHDEIRIVFTDDKVSEVELKKNIDEKTRNAKRTVKSAILSANSVARYTLLDSPIYASVRYTDGSYRKTLVTIEDSPYANKIGKTTVSWFDEWSGENAKAEVNVTAMSNELRGRFDDESDYVLTKFEGGYSMTVEPRVAFTDEIRAYPWKRLKQFVIDELKYVTIAGGVTKIETSSFSDCVALKSAVIGNDVKEIKSYAFEKCKALRDVYFGRAVERIEDAFTNCQSLENIILHENVTDIGEWAFLGCKSLIRISVAEGNPKYYSEENCLIERETETLIKASNSTSRIPYRVKNIQSGAFHNLKDLKEINISGSVSLPEGVFAGCNSLESIEASGRKYHSNGNCLIETETKTLIAGCASSVIPLDGSVARIGDSAFDGREALTEIAIPESVASIGMGAFDGTGIWNNTPANSVVYADRWIVGKKGNLPKELKLKGAGISDYAFWYETDLRSVILEEGIKHIGKYAFYGCESLVNVKIPSSVAHIGEKAFFSTKFWNDAADESIVYADRWAIGSKGNLEKFEFKSDTVGIGDNAFSETYRYGETLILSNVNYIGASAFKNCQSLKTVVLPEKEIEIGAEAFFGCPIETAKIPTTAISSIPKKYLKNVEINGGTEIGQMAFDGCENLQSVKIGSDVTKIEGYAFYNCASLSEIEFHEGITVLGYSVFAGTAWFNNQPNGELYVGKVFYKYIGLPTDTRITIREGTTMIANGAFRNCRDLIEIEIPSSVTCFATHAFAGCNDLVVFRYNGTKAQWKEIYKDIWWNDSTGEYSVYCTDGTLTKAESEAV